MNIQQSFGALIKQKREARRITLPALAGACRMSKGNLSKIESGQGNPTLTTLEKLAKVLRITIRIK